MEHTATIEWPNGNGYTPCSEEYRRVLDEKKSIEYKYQDAVSMNDYSREDYETWNRLEDRLATLHADGHIGKSVRY